MYSRLFLLTLVLIIAPFRLASALPTLDQSALPWDFPVFALRDSFLVFSGIDAGGPDKAQTFTVGLSGKLLEVDVAISRSQTFFFPPGNLFWDLRGTIGGVPVNTDSSPLASAVINGNEVPSGAYVYFPIDLSPFNIFVTPGEVLAIVLQAADPMDPYSWAGFASWNSPYSRGSAYYRNPPGPWTSESGDVLSFRTYVGDATDSAPNESPIFSAPIVSQPPTFLFLGSGLAGLAGVAWRRHRRG